MVYELETVLDLDPAKQRAGDDGVPLHKVFMLDTGHGLRGCRGDKTGGAETDNRLSVRPTLDIADELARGLAHLDSSDLGKIAGLDEQLLQ